MHKACMQCQEALDIEKSLLVGGKRLEIAVLKLLVAQVVALELL